MIADLETETLALGERARRATVVVCSGRSSGAGIRLGGDRVVTCAHCLHEANARVDLDGRTLAATIERYDAEADVAVLRLQDADPAPPLELRPSATLRPGELVFAFGHPLGARDVLARGSVRRATERLVVSDVPLAPGNSGGPLFDAAGRLAGMNAAIARDRSFSVATETIHRVAGGSASRRLGIAAAPARVRLAGGHASDALVMTDVRAGSDAERSALALGDAIVAIDGRPLAGGDAVGRLRAARNLTILRGGRLHDLALVRAAKTEAAAA